MPIAGSVVALDVGSKRIGVAVSDPLGSFAFPHDTIERTNVRDDVERIVEIARERNAKTIVVGDPLTMKGERGIAAGNIDAFVAHLARGFDGAIERIDERSHHRRRAEVAHRCRRVAREAQDGGR